MKISQKERELFISEIRRTRMSYSKLNGCFLEKEKPKYTVAFFLDIETGKTKKIEKFIWQEIVTFLDTLPTISNIAIKPTSRLKISITEAMRMELKAEFERTGKTGAAILRMCPRYLDSLNNLKITRWLSGDNVKTYIDEWEFVLKAIKSFPDRPKKFKKVKVISPSCATNKMDQVSISDEIKEELIQLKMATGLSPNKLYEQSDSSPKTLNGTMINHWILGTTKTASEAHLSWVLIEYKAQAKRQQKMLEIILQN
ncbi:MAG: hypothetical protein JKY84_02485 [Emcibacteraceae bacterium]|nr:hypothetical protein [Emcibacteraceae bacterium]